VLELCRELGLEDRLISASEAAARNRYLFLDGRLCLLPTGFLPFLRSDLLSWPAKLAILTERFRGRGNNESDESIDQFARRRAGREVAEKLVDAMVTGIHAGDSQLLSLRAAFPRIASFERHFGSVTRGMRAASQKRVAAGGRASGRTWSFSGGLQTLIDSVREKLKRPPVAGSAAVLVRFSGNQWEVRDAAGRSRFADAVVLACPAYEQSALLTEVDRELAALAGGIPYNRVAVVALGYRTEDVPDRLNGFGYLSPQRSRRDVLGVQWCSSIFPGYRAPAGMVLLRAMCGGWNRPEVVEWDDDRLAAAVRAELRQALRIEAAPLFRRLIRWRQAIPQYHVGHLERVARIEARLAAHSGLFLGGNAYRGIALPDCVEQAGKLAKRVAEWLAK
jgi:oxygen-dependent protoporphyrinogen oxidase